ncbi:MAG TPA: alpha/beta hydrolase-fold protein [Luteibacter sp.]|nr:alpha/beta hydrolase-fold protein [Luteibacter sp.]
MAIRPFAALLLSIVLLAACSHDIPAAPATAVAPGVPATPPPTPPPAYVLDHTEVRDIPSKVLKRDYQIYVSLPASYRERPDRHYPVLFVTDAPYAFPLIRSIARRVGDHGDGLDDFILVGLSYAKGDTPVYSRDRDYTPTPNGSPDAVSDMPGRPVLYGEADGYRRFIAEEVFPFVASHYRADMHDKIYAGHSYGGLLGVQILLTDPTMFEHYILGSPSLQFDNKVMFRWEQTYAASHKDMPADVFIAIGSFETIKPESGNPRYHHENDMVRNWQAMEKRLTSRHYPGLRVHSTIIDDEDHLTVFPSIITRGLMAMLPATHKEQDAKP